MAPGAANSLDAKQTAGSGRDLRHIVIAAMVATALILASAGVLMIYAGAFINSLTASRETSLLANALERKEERVHDDLSSATIWNEAYEKSSKTYDAAWADLNYGLYFHDYMRHDATVAYDAADKLVYVSQDGEVRPLADAGAFIAAAQALIAKARADEARKVTANPKATAFERVGATEGVFKAGDDIFIAAVSTVAPEDNYTGSMTPRSALVITAVRVDAEFLKDLEKNYNITGAALSLAKPKKGPSIPLTGLDRKPVGYVTWKPERPAATFFADAKLAIILAAAIIALGLAALFFHIRKLAGRLVLAKEAAQAADEAKSAFLATMSHEIRTPLNGVLGMTQVMEADELSSVQRERVNVIRESGRALLAILNDVLDLSKVEAGKLELEVGQFDMAELAAAVCSTFQGSAAARDLALSFEIAPDARGAWIGDALRLRQVLSNLVSNAIKFTHVGCVTLAISRDSAGLTFAIQDTGIGMEATVLPTLFQKFSQADASTARRYGGTGLGLSISRELVELMGGRMEVTSKLGEGSRFFFHIILPRGDVMAAVASVEAAPMESSETSDQPLRILAAEDNPTNQLVLRALLQPTGAEVLIVDDGAQAVRAFEADRFDLVLMDVQMPVMNGVEATEAIRDFEARMKRPRTPILALSGNVMSHQVAEYSAAGMDGCVAKPIEVEKLFAAMEAALDGPAADEAEQAA